MRKKRWGLFMKTLREQLDDTFSLERAASAKSIQEALIIVEAECHKLMHVAKQMDALLEECAKELNNDADIFALYEAAKAPRTISAEELERIARAIYREYQSSAGIDKVHVEWCVDNFWHKALPEAKPALATLGITVGD
jgi:hypothetical protein